MQAISWPIVVADGLDIRLYRAAEAIDIEHIDLPGMDAWDAEGRRLALVPTTSKGRFLGLLSIDQEAVEVRLKQPVRSDAPMLLTRLGDALRSIGADVPDEITLSSALSLCISRFGVN